MAVIAASVSSVCSKNTHVLLTTLENYYTGEKSEICDHSWNYRRGSESVASSVVSGTKLPIFIGYKSQHCHYPNQHCHYTVADVFADS